jgi:hypothetical protein
MDGAVGYSGYGGPAYDYLLQQATHLSYPMPVAETIFKRPSGRFIGVGAGNQSRTANGPFF